MSLIEWAPRRHNNTIWGPVPDPCLSSGRVCHGSCRRRLRRVLGRTLPSRRRRTESQLFKKFWYTRRNRPSCCLTLKLQDKNSWSLCFRQNYEYMLKLVTTQQNITAGWCKSFGKEVDSSACQNISNKWQNDLFHRKVRKRLWKSF